MLPGRWRYELAPEGDSATRVTETYDYTAMMPKLVAHNGFPEQNQRSIEATLQRLKAYVEGEKD
jgi:hypothetical protein